MASHGSLFRPQENLISLKTPWLSLQSFHGQDLPKPRLWAAEHRGQLLLRVLRVGVIILKLLDKDGPSEKAVLAAEITQ